MRIIALGFIIAFAVSCSSNTKPAVQAEEIKTYDTSVFYYDIPLAAKNEIAEIKRVFAFTYMINEENGKRDSIAIDTTELMQLAAPFLQYNLNESKYRKYYKEDRFEDGDTKSFVLNYSTNHPDFPVRSASILLDNETQKLKRIDIFRSFAAGDSITEERLAWNAGKNFQVIKITSKGDKEFIRQTNVFWKDR